MRLGKRCATWIAALAVAAAVAACGSSAPRPTTSTSATTPHGDRPVVHSSPHRSSARRPAGSAPAGPRVGASRRVKALTTRLTVTVSRVIDPLRDSGAAVLPGNRAVGVLIQISDDGPAVYNSSATGDVSVVPSSGVATPLFVPRGVCQTPLRDFDNYISPGGSTSGCVAFSLSAHAAVRTVDFSPNAQPKGRVTWAVSP